MLHWIANLIITCLGGAIFLPEWNKVRRISVPTVHYIVDYVTPDTGIVTMKKEQRERTQF